MLLRTTLLADWIILKAGGMRSVSSSAQNIRLSQLMVSCLLQRTKKSLSSVSSSLTRSVDGRFVDTVSHVFLVKVTH